MDKGKILIVDDDPIVRDVLSDVLRKVGGYKTDVAIDGTEGIKKFMDNEYDMIFTDISMPGMSGIDLLKEARRINPAVPIVVITAYSTIENAITAMKEGARDFITKPFHIEKIASTADRIIGEQRLLGKVLKKDNYKESIELLNQELFKKLQEIAILQTISSELDLIYDNKKIYQGIVEMASTLLKVKEVSFGIIERGVFSIRGAIGVVKKDIKIDSTIFEHVVRTGNHYLARFGEINPHSGAPLTAPFLSIPFTMNNEVFGILNLSNKADGTGFSEDEIFLAITFAKKASLRIENNALYDVLYSNLINTLKSLVMSIEARDSYTKQHSERVTAYALEIAEVMNLSEDEKDVIRFGGYLHDIGKIGVRDTVLLKPDRLTEEEKAEIRLHPVIGDNIIKPIKFLPKERELVLYHHERFDGNGYPEGLEGERIPRIARILAVADTYDAMTSSRPYRTARTHDFAIEELKRCSNTQFDGEVVKAFLKTMTGRGRIHEA